MIWSLVRPRRRSPSLVSQSTPARLPSTSGSPPFLYRYSVTSGWIDTLFTLARLLQLRRVSVARQAGPAENVPGASRQGLNLGRVCVPATGKRSDPGGDGEEPWLPRISSRLRLRSAICDLEEIRLARLLLVLKLLALASVAQLSLD